MFIISRWCSRLMLAAVTVSACACLPLVADAKAPDAVKMVDMTQTVSNFDRIVVSGNIELRLVTAKPAAKQSITTQYPSNQNYTIVVKQGELTLRQTTPWWVTTKPAIITVPVSDLKKISAYDAVSITADSLNLSALEISADTSGDINLDGQFGLTALDLKGPGKVKIAWVDSPSLSIDSSGDSQIELSGKVKQMHIKLSGHSALNAEYIRADSVAIQTNRFAKAQVMPLTTLNAFAHDFSNIFYYKTPKYFTRFTSQSGNVLQMEWRES